MTLTLEASKAIQGVAGSATAVTYSIFGDEVSGSTNVFKLLQQGQLAASAGVLYTPTGVSAIVKSIVLANTTGGGVAVTIYVGGTAAANSIGSFTIPANGHASWTSGGWNMRDASGAAVAVGTVTLTGDVTGTGVGSVATTLATVNAGVGSFGTATQVPAVTVNAKGLVTAAANTAIQIAESQVTNLVTDLAGKQATGNYITALTTDVTASGPGSVAATIANNAVTNVKAADMATATIKGRTTAGTGDPEDLTASQAKGVLAIVPGDVTGFDAQVRTSRLDQMAAPTGPVSFNSQRITAVADAVSATDVPNFAQVQAIAEGRADKEAVEWTTTAAVTLLGLGTQVGGEWTGTLLVTDRVLVKDQALSKDDGIYTPSAGAWTRTVDANTGAEITDATVLVEQGTTSRGDTWRQSAVVTTIGTDPQTWVLIGEGDPITLAAVGASPNANAASLAGQALTLQPASASFPGLVTAAQFVILSNTSGANSGNVTLGAVGASPNANAATLTAQALNLELANASFPGLVSAAQFTKLAGIATGATANSADAFLLDRTNHTGTQLAATVSDFATAVTNVIGDLDVYDNFSRTVPAGGWGTANTGQAWTVAGTASDFAVAAGVGTMALPTANTGKGVLLEAGSVDQDIYVDFTWASTVTVATVGCFIHGRYSGGGTNCYQISLILSTSGTYSADLVKIASGVQGALASNFTTGAFTPGAYLRSRLQIRGTTISAKIWAATSTEPAAWQASVTDSSVTSGTQFEIDLFRNSGNTSATPTASFDNFKVFVPTDAVVNIAPAAVENRHLYPAAANTVKANATNAVAVPTDVAVTANTFLARSSTGDLAAKAITDPGLAWVALTTLAAQTAALNPATTTLQGMMSASDKIRMGARFNARADLGFVGDLITTNSTTSASTGTATTITDSANPFQPFAGNVNYYVGKRITLAGAGASGAVYVGTITAVNSAGSVTVTPGISTTVSNRICSFGTDETAATTAMNTLVNTTNALFPGVVIEFGVSPTNAYGFPIPVLWNKTSQVEGMGGGHTADTGDYSRIGGTRLAWWGTSCDGGTAFGAFWTISPTGVQSLKKPAMRSCWLDCRNGDQNEALIGLKLASCQGWALDDFFVMDPMAIGIWFDVATSPTEAKDCTRGFATNVGFRCLDNTSGPAAVTLTPTTTSSAVNIATAQSLTLAAANGLRAGSDYIWVMTNTGKPTLARYTGGGGTTTLTGVICSAEDAPQTPTTVSGSNVVQCSPSNAAAMYLNGGTGANTCCNTFLQVAVSHGGTWGPAAVEFGNSDSNDFQSVYINGGTRAHLGAINRMTKPGIRMNGSNVSLSLAARNNTFRGGDPGSLPTTNGGAEFMALLNTGARMLAPSGPSYWDLYQLGNGAPMPVVESGAHLDWNPNGGMRDGAAGAVAVADQAITAATLTLIPGTLMVVPPQGLQIGTVLRWTIIGTTSAAGTAGGNVSVRIGTAGTTADAAAASFTTGTALATAGEFLMQIFFTVRGPLGGTSSASATMSIQSSSNAATPIAAGMLNTLSAMFAGTITTFNTSSSGLLYASVSFTTGAAKVPTIKQSFCEVIHPANP